MFCNIFFIWRGCLPYKFRATYFNFTHQMYVQIKVVAFYFEWPESISDVLADTYELPLKRKQLPNHHKSAMRAYDHL